MKIIFDFVGINHKDAAQTLVDLFNRGGFHQALEMHCGFKKIYIEEIKFQPRQKNTDDIEIKIKT